MLTDPVGAPSCAPLDARTATLLLSLTSKLVACRTIEAAADALLDAALQLHAARHGKVQLIEAGSAHLRVVAHRGLDDDIVAALDALSVEEPLPCARAAAERRRVVVPEIGRERGCEALLPIVERMGCHSVCAFPMVGSDGTLVGVLSILSGAPGLPPSPTIEITGLLALEAADVVSRCRSEEALRADAERQRLLLEEADHRYRNMLGVIGAISRQTAKLSPNPTAFAQAFAERLTAIERAQRLLTGSREETVDLREVVCDQVLVSDADERIRCDGPSLPIRGDEALAIGLLVHELATNARKHGALSDDAGRVEVTWAEARDAKGRFVELRWNERDGPTVEPPVRSGFGSALMARVLAANGGEGGARYEPGGVVCELKLRLAPAPDGEVPAAARLNGTGKEGGAHR